MSLRVKYVIVEADESRLTEDQVEVLQRLRHPERLHAIAQLRLSRDSNITYSCVCEFRFSQVGNCRPHFPGGILESGVICDSVQDKDALYGFWT